MSQTIKIATMYPHVGHSDCISSFVYLNLSFSMGLNCLTIILAITGLLNSVVSALIHNAGSVIVIISSAFVFCRKT